MSSTIAFPSAARTATANSAPINSLSNNGGHVVLDVTAVTATPSIVVKIQGYDSASDKWYDILSGTAVTAVSTVVYSVHPSLTAAAGSVAKDLIPDTIRIRVEHADADSITYSVGVNLT